MVNKIVPVFLYFYKIWKTPPPSPNTTVPWKRFVYELSPVEFGDARYNTKLSLYNSDTVYQSIPWSLFIKYNICTCTDFIIFTHVVQKTIILNFLSRTDTVEARHEGTTSKQWMHDILAHLGKVNFVKQNSIKAPLFFLLWPESIDYNQKFLFLKKIKMYKN